MKIRLSIAVLLAIFYGCSQNSSTNLILPDNPSFVYTGRFDMRDRSKPVFMYSGCSIKTIFTGTSVELLLKDDSLRNFFTVIIDDSLFVIEANRSDSTYRLAENLEKGKHTLEIIRRSEWHGGNTSFLGLRLDPKSKVQKPAQNERRMEFIGDSYTCGYGNEGKSQTENFKYSTENNYMSFGAITARNVNADYVAVCRSGIGIVQGYGGSRGFNMPRFYDEVTLDTTIIWDYTQYQPHVVFLDLIANDLSAKLDSAEFLTKYIEFVKRIRSNYPEANIVCAAGPSGPGEDWERTQSYIHTAYNELSKNDPKVNYFEFSPFEPEGSDWHPTVDQHMNMAEELTPFIKKLMNW